MNKTNSIALALVCFFNAFLYSQDKEKDSIISNAKENGFVVVDTIETKKQTLDPLRPSKAAFYSAVLPGLGQIYNKKYWKLPIVYGAIGAGVYFYKRNDTNYERYRTAFKRRKAGFIDDEFYGTDADGNPLSSPILSEQALEDAQQKFQRDRDLSLLITILFYALNIIDANVDGHLNQYNMSDDLSMKFKPYIRQDYLTSNANFGMSLTINF